MVKKKKNDMHKIVHQKNLATKQVSARVANASTCRRWLNLAQLWKISIQVSANEKVIVEHLWTRVDDQEEQNDMRQNLYQACWQLRRYPRV